MPHVVSQFTDQGSNPHSLQWNCGVLTTGLPGKFPSMTSVIHVLLSPTKKKFVKLSYFGNIYIIYKYDISLRFIPLSPYGQFYKFPKSFLFSSMI